MGLSLMMNSDIGHDRVTHFRSGREYTSRDLWR